MSGKKWDRRRARQRLKCLARKERKLWFAFKMNAFENGTPDYICDICGEDFHATILVGDLNVCEDCLDVQNDEIRMKNEEDIDSAELSWV